MVPQKPKEIRTNEDIDAVCDYILHEYAVAEQEGRVLPDPVPPLEQSSEDVASEKELTREDLNNMDIGELRKLYLSDNELVKNEVFEDPNNPHAPCGMPMVPSANFTETNEDIGIDPAVNIGNDAVPVTAMNIYSSNFEIKE